MKLLQQYNWYRKLHLGFIGLTFSRPITHAWYALVEGRVVPKLAALASSALSSHAMKLVLDALIFSPVAVTGYFCWRSTLERGKFQHKLRDKWWTALQASWSFLPVANAVNFAVAPLACRVLYNINFVWNTYLFSVNHSHGLIEPSESWLSNRYVAVHE